jgi:energy-coupling factor transporter transmembrane protein EcfT
MDYRLLIFAILVALAIAAKLGSRRLYVFAKPLPILFIIFLAFINPHVPPGLWLAAIGFGLAGDLLLLSEKGFLPGLLSFFSGTSTLSLHFTAPRPAAYRLRGSRGRRRVPGGVCLPNAAPRAGQGARNISCRSFAYIAVTGILIAISLKYPIVSFAVRRHGSLRTLRFFVGV